MKNILITDLEGVLIASYIEFIHYKETLKYSDYNSARKSA